MENLKNDPKQMTKHHRKPLKLGGTNEERNISMIPRDKHEAWHLIFNHHDVAEIARIISDTYLDPEYILIPIRKSV